MAGRSRPHQPRAASPSGTRPCPGTGWGSLHAPHLGLVHVVAHSHRHTHSQWGLPTRSLATLQRRRQSQLPRPARCPGPLCAQSKTPSGCRYAQSPHTAHRLGALALGGKFDAAVGSAGRGMLRLWRTLARVSEAAAHDDVPCDGDAGVPMAVDQVSYWCRCRCPSPRRCASALSSVVQRDLTVDAHPGSTARCHASQKRHWHRWYGPQTLLTDTGMATAPETGTGVQLTHCGH